jgi:hypothetical protein
MRYGRGAIFDDCVHGEGGGAGGIDGRIWKTGVIGGRICRQWFSHVALSYAEPHV